LFKTTKKLSVQQQRLDQDPWQWLNEQEKHSIKFVQRCGRPVSR
jgi:hypothetical protein